MNALLPRLSPEADHLLHMLKYLDPHRSVYWSPRSGVWCVTHGGGRVSASAVHELVQKGLVAPLYSNCPEEAFHVGRTLDVDATIAAREKAGNRKVLVYKDPPLFPCQPRKERE